MSYPSDFKRTKSKTLRTANSDAIHMAREHRQNAIQYLYLHLLTTKFVEILLILTQKCHIPQISNEQKVRHLEQPSRRKTR